MKCARTGNMTKIFRDNLKLKGQLTIRSKETTLFTPLCLSVVISVFRVVFVSAIKVKASTVPCS